MCSAASPGHSTLNDKLLIIDMDGTLLSINSFRPWVLHSLRYWPLVTLWIMFKRKCLRQPHAQAKQALQKLWQRANERQLQRLLAVLHQHIRPNMQDVLAVIAHKEAAALFATSAAGVYAVPFAQSLGFSHIIATPAGGHENARKEKCTNALAYIAAQGWEHKKRIFFTDHMEDTPLAQHSQRLLWFGSEEDLDAVSCVAYGTEAVYAAAFSAPELLKACA